MKTTILCFLLLFGSNLFAQKITFEMTAFGINFGQMTVTRTIENDSTELYTLKAKGYLKVLWMERDDETHNSVRFQNGRLISSNFKQMESKELTKWNTVSFDGKRYIVDSNQGKYFLTETPEFSVLKLYFMHPKSITRVFSEAEGGFVNLKHVNENTVEMKNAKGDRSVYFYKNGAIEKLEFHTSIAKVNMKRI